MKKLLATLGLAVLLVPSIALADENAAPNSGAMPARMAQFQQAHERMRQLHQQARSQVLASLSAAHKQAVANIVGQLAISASPNPDAAARQINALLTPSESQSVVRIHNGLRSQMQSLMQSLHAQMQPAAGAPPRLERQEMNESTDAGHLLLKLLVGGPGMHHGM
ncbi:MAG: hypothetical protein JO060_12215 [Candidatus Eremiobacteraeota bacterium]|nr:hypothetical protein [Candidatus Eremiobacteraeota bacterium]